MSYLTPLVVGDPNAVQTVPMRPDQVGNNAGGYVWAIDKWAQLHRWAITGSAGGTYYVNEHDLTAENIDVVKSCIAEDGLRVVREIVAISTAGRAPKNDQAILALAACAGLGDAATKRAALDALPAVCRIPTHLFQFLTFVQAYRGWGRSLRRAVGKWYTDKPIDDVAYQVVKYRNREGWTHRDALRLAHPARAVSGNNPTLDVSAEHAALFGWIAKQSNAIDAPLPARIVEGYVLAQWAELPADSATIVREYGIPRECVKPEHLTDPDVWAALLDTMPMTAMIRNLATMTRVGLLSPTADATRTVVERLADGERIRKARVHPIAVLAALKTYAQGHGERSSHTWAPVPRVVDALDGAFYAAFGNVQPTNKRYMLALDVSGSMDGALVAGIPGLTARVVTGAMALVTAAVEPLYSAVAFTSASESQMGGRWGGGTPSLTPLALSPRQRLDDVVKAMSALRMGGTDCALPMLYAAEKNIPVDVFAVWTDNETWAGSVHPAEALRRYRDKTGIPARLVVCATSSSGFSIADPKDAGMLDVCGFDTATPQIIAEFASGTL